MELRSLVVPGSCLLTRFVFKSYGFIVPWPCRLTLLVPSKEPTSQCICFSVHEKKQEERKVVS
jgi:hypothetical protein